MGACFTIIWIRCTLVSQLNPVQVLGSLLANLKTYFSSQLLFLNIFGLNYVICTSCISFVKSVMLVGDVLKPRMKVVGGCLDKVSVALEVL